MKDCIVPKDWEYLLNKINTHETPSISFMSPIEDTDKVKSIQFGSIYLSENGEELSQPIP